MNDLQSIYKALYSRGDYGHSDHGKYAHNIVYNLGVKSLVDVGCGDGQFVMWSKRQGIDAVGVDFASGFGVEAFAHDLPFKRHQYEYVTAFDMLEHLEEDSIEGVLDEFDRVASIGWLFSICYNQSVSKGVNGELLHPTVKPETWWIEKIGKYGRVEKQRQYIILEK